MFTRDVCDEEGRGGHRTRERRGEKVGRDTERSRHRERRRCNPEMCVWEEGTRDERKGRVK